MRLGWGVDLTLHLTASTLKALGHEVRLYCANHDGSYSLAPYDLIHKPVVYHEQEVVDAQVWNERKTIDLMTLNPTPQKITRAKISSRGWSWESFTILPWFSTD